MAWLAPWIATAFALFGAACLTLSAFIGVTARSDEVLDAAQVSFITAAVIFLGYMGIGLLREFLDTRSTAG
jgi:hypothetical protein